MYTASSISSLRIEPYPALSNPTPNPYIELLSGNSQHHLLPRRHFFPFKITPNITPSPSLSFSHTTQSRRSHRQQTNTLRMPISAPRPLRARSTKFCVNIVATIPAAARPVGTALSYFQSCLRTASVFALRAARVG